MISIVFSSVNESPSGLQGVKAQGRLGSSIERFLKGCQFSHFSCLLIISGIQADRLRCRFSALKIRKIATLRQLAKWKMGHELLVF